MAKAKKFGQITHFTKDSTVMEKNTAMEDLTGPTGRLMKEHLLTITSMATEFTLGPMVANTPDSGTSTRCTAAASSSGLMGEGTKENTLMTKKKDGFLCCF